MARGGVRTRTWCFSCERTLRFRVAACKKSTASIISPRTTKPGLESTYRWDLPCNRDVEMNFIEFQSFSRETRLSRNSVARVKRMFRDTASFHSRCYADKSN